MEIEIITPPVADETDIIDHGLITLTKAICQATGEESAWGLGGRFGYGENFENDVFVMRSQYWGDCTCGAMDCEDEDKDCDPACPMVLPNFLHKASGFEVRWYKWIGRDNEVKKADGINLQTVFAECVGSLRLALAEEARES